MALAEANSDVALEPDVVLRGELEGAEDGCEDTLLTTVLPLSKNGRVRGATVVVCDEVLVLSVVVHGVCNTAPGKPAVDRVGLDINLQHQIVSNLGSRYILAVGVADSHGAGGRRSSVGYGACGGQHGDVEANINGLDAGLVDAAHPVGLGLEGHQLRVLLDNEDEVCFALKYY